MSNISKEGEKFIEDLNLYLFSTGKSEQQIKEFIQEAEEHLILGEKEGKTIKDIFGDSPEEYAKSVAKEISFDKVDVLQTAFIFILGFGAWIFLGGIDNKVFTMSLVEAVATPIIFLITLFLIFYSSRKFAFKDRKWTISLFVIFILNIASLVVVGLIGRSMDQTIVLNRLIVNLIIIILFVSLFIISKKIDTWILMLPFIWYVGVIISNFTSINLADNSVLRIVSPILGLVFTVLESKRMTREKA